jgi:hypothetical protein
MRALLPSIAIAASAGRRREPRHGDQAGEGGASSARKRLSVPGRRQGGREQANDSAMAVRPSFRRPRSAPDAVHARTAAPATSLTRARPPLVETRKGVSCTQRTLGLDQDAALERAEAEAASRQPPGPGTRLLACGSSARHKPGLDGGLQPRHGFGCSAADVSPQTDRPNRARQPQERPA